MFCAPSKTVVARKKHTCTNCGQAILAGESYAKWGSVDDSWFTNKMHPECLESLIEENDYYGTFDYMPYGGERPKREQNEILQS